MAENTSTGFTLDTPDAIEFFQRNAALRGLAIEIVTGMKLSRNGSGLDAVRMQGLLPAGRTSKAAGLRKAVEKMQELYPQWEVSKSLKTALSK